MATLYVSEYRDVGVQRGNVIPAPSSPPLVEQHISIGGSSTASAAFATNTNFILVHTDAICSLAFGASPVAVATAHRVAANETRFYVVQPGDKIAVITNS